MLDAQMSNVEIFEFVRDTRAKLEELETEIKGLKLSLQTSVEARQRLETLVQNVTNDFSKRLLETDGHVSTVETKLVAIANSVTTDGLILSERAQRKLMDILVQFHGHKEGEQT